MIETTQQFGAALRVRRKSLGLTQRDLALVCGTGSRFIGELERGKETCQIGKALTVMQALGLHLTLDNRSKQLTTASAR